MVQDVKGLSTNLHVSTLPVWNPEALGNREISIRKAGAVDLISPALAKLVGIGKRRNKRAGGPGSCYVACSTAVVTADRRDLLGKKRV